MSSEPDTTTTDISTTDALTPAELAADGRRVVLIDDDPTGTQSASGVEIILSPKPAELDRFFASAARAAYLLSNSRALPVDEARELVGRLIDQTRAAAARAGCRVAIILRGDSTLRGHVFEEIDLLQEPDGVTLFVPAFPEAGRVTRDGVHWLVDGRGVRTPVADTEFARDHEFGYSGRALVDWVAERGGGRPAVMVPLAQVRRHGAQALHEALRTAPAGSVVIPEAETTEDLLHVARGLLRAEAEGRQVTVRAASSFAAIRAGLAPASVAPPVAVDGGVLVVCGSHTMATTGQLRTLQDAADLDPVVLAPDCPDDDGRLVAVVREQLRWGGVALVTTPRVFDSGHHGGELMARLVRVTRAALDLATVVVSKGGITSAEVARSAMGADRAYVSGQVAPGVPLWQVPCADRDRSLIVVPGNVGGDDLLAELVHGVRRKVHTHG